MTPNPNCGCGSTPPAQWIDENPPGQDAIRRRIGTHDSFLTALTTAVAQSPALRGLKTRVTSDPSFSLLDAWATVADVVTFYQERFANEAFLRTATERRTIAELARLVDYQLRPGVAASVPLAFLLDDTDPTARAIVPAGTPAQSVPRPGEVPQTFETTDLLAARAEWNLLPIRVSRPQDLSKPTIVDGRSVLLQGIATNLRPGDGLLIAYYDVNGAETGDPIFGFVKTVEPDAVANRTRVTISLPQPNPAAGPSKTAVPITKSASVIDKEGALFQQLVATSDRQASQAVGARSSSDALLKDVVKDDRELARRIMSTTRPDLREVFHQALRGQQPTPASAKVFALRLTSPVFGHNAVTPQVPIVTTTTDHDGKVTTTTQLSPNPWNYVALDKDQSILWLDLANAPVAAGDRVVVNSPAGVDCLNAKTVTYEDRADYNLSVRTTKIAVDKPWMASVSFDNKPELQRLKQATVFAGAQELVLADEPLPDDDPIRDDVIAMQTFVPDLEPGRLLVVSGERTDLTGVTGVNAAELVKIKVVQQVEPDEGVKVDGVKDVAPVTPNGRRFTLLQLDRQLANTYRRDTAKVYGNVAWATHGESRDEVLGNGDASAAWLSFQLRQSPITRLPAPTPSGSQSTLEVRVNNVLWHEVDRLADAGPTDHVYSTQTDDQGRTTVTFGDGTHGARPPSGSENVRAHFRVGMGTAGNVTAGQVMLLTQPPPGVRSVINPLDATGGTDAEGLDRARRNAPLATLTLGRVVSVTDFAAFTRTFAGIGKAESVLLTVNHRQVIQVTAAGQDDATLSPDSDLMTNLVQALAANAKARMPFRVDPRERVFVFLGAGVRIDTDYDWTDIRGKLRSSLANAFRFEDRGLGRGMFQSEVVAALQSVKGVLAIEMDYFFGVPERETLTPPNGAKASARVLKSPQNICDEVQNLIAPPANESPDDKARRLAASLRISVPALPAGLDGGVVRPAQIAYFGPETLDELKATVSFRLIQT